MKDITTNTERATISAGTRPGFVEITFPGKPDTTSAGARSTLERDNAEKLELLRHYAAGRGVSALVDTVPGFKPYEVRTA